MTAPQIDVFAQRDTSLSDGTLDRTLLAAAVTFALDSLRAGHVGWVSGRVVPGLLDSGLVWKQTTWLEVPGYDENGYPAGPDDQRIPVRAADCGTACCIAGWINIAAGGIETALENLQVGDGEGGSGVEVRDHAVYQLFGQEGHLIVGHAQMSGFEATRELFYGENDVNDVVRAADQLLRACGQDVLVLTADGTFQ